MLKTKYIIYLLLSIPLLLVILVRKKAFLRHVEWLDLSVTMVAKNRRWTILSLLFTNYARSPETPPFGGGRILHFIFAVNMSPARPDIFFFTDLQNLLIERSNSGLYLHAPLSLFLERGMATHLDFSSCSYLRVAVVAYRRTTLNIKIYSLIYEIFFYIPCFIYFCTIPWNTPRKYTWPYCSYRVQQDNKYEIITFSLSESILFI